MQDHWSQGNSRWSLSSKPAHVKRSVYIYMSFDALYLLLHVLTSCCMEQYDFLFFANLKHSLWEGLKSEIAGCQC